MVIAQLTRDDLRLVREGITMFMFVPYRAKPVLTVPDTTVLENLDQRLLEILMRDPPGTQRNMDVELTQQELTVIVTILEADIRGCGIEDNESSRIEFRVHFCTDRATVKSLLGRLLLCRTPDNG